MMGRKERALYREGAKWNDLTQTFTGGKTDYWRPTITTTITTPMKWAAMSFQNKCKFIARRISGGWPKQRLANFMKKTLNVGEAEWMKCVNALDENCNYVEGGS